MKPFHRLPQRLRPRHLVAGALGAWAVAVVVPLCWTLPAAIGIGGSVRALRAEASILSSGWTGTIVHRPPSGGSAGVTAWELSAGPRSTISIRPGTAAIGLLMRPQWCPGGATQTVAATGEDVVTGQDYVLARAFSWYTIHMRPVRVTSELTLTYGCLLTPPPGTGKAPSAVALGGIRLQGG